MSDAAPKPLPPLLESEWPCVLRFLPEDLTELAMETGAFHRSREVESGADLLRMVLAYSACDLSLRQTAAWAGLAGVGKLSDVAVLKRLKKCRVFMGRLVAWWLDRLDIKPVEEKLRLRLVDATTISRPGSDGTDWRIHVSYDLAARKIDSVDLTDKHGGESLRRFEGAPGEILVGDRGYAAIGGLEAATQAGCDLLVRMGWRSVRLLDEGGQEFDVLTWAKTIPKFTPCECEVTIPLPSGHRKVRLIGVRKSPEVVEKEVRRLRQKASRKQAQLDPRTLEAASYMFLLCTVPWQRLAIHDALMTYRLRWQIELAFKRLKSLIFLDELRARDPDLAQVYLLGKILAGLVADELVNRAQALFPWGYPLLRESP